MTFDFRLQKKNPIKYRGIVWNTWYFHDTDLGISIRATTNIVDVPALCDTDVVIIAGCDIEKAYEKALRWVNAHLDRPRKQFPGHCSHCGLAVMWVASKNGVQQKFDPLIEDGKTVMKIHACKKRSETIPTKKEFDHTNARTKASLRNTHYSAERQVR